MGALDPYEKPICNCILIYNIEARYEDETIWLSQKLMAQLFDVDVRTVNEHLKNIYDQGELVREATIRKFRIVQTEGNRDVSRNVEFYNLDATSVDYNKDAPTTRAFFARVQDRLFESDFDRVVKQLKQKEVNKKK